MNFFNEKVKIVMFGERHKVISYFFFICFDIVTGMSLFLAKKRLGNYSVICIRIHSPITNSSAQAVVKKTTL